MDKENYEMIRDEVKRIQKELADIPIGDENREALAKELKIYNDILVEQTRAEAEVIKTATEADARKKDRIMGLVKVGIMSITGLIAIKMTTDFEKTDIITTKAWQIATKILPIAKV